MGLSKTPSDRMSAVAGRFLMFSIQYRKLNHCGGPLVPSLLIVRTTFSLINRVLFMQKKAPTFLETIRNDLAPAAQYPLLVQEGFALDKLDVPL
jgi:hypothetical protein